MDSNIVSIHVANYETVFTNFHEISSEYVIEILGFEEYEHMNKKLDRAFGLKFISCDGYEYIFSIEDKNKYLMAKILYGV